MLINCRQVGDQLDKIRPREESRSKFMFVC
jgi:hypothetical protein